VQFRVVTRRSAIAKARFQFPTILCKILGRQVDAETEVFSEFCGSALSKSVLQWPILIFISIQLLKREAGESWEYSNKACSIFSIIIIIVIIMFIKD
jgi:hypothetical protein